MPSSNRTRASAALANLQIQIQVCNPHFLYIPDATEIDCPPWGTLAKLGLTRTFSYLQDSVLPRPELALEARRTIPARAPSVATRVDLAVLEVRRECTICFGYRGGCLFCRAGIESRPRCDTHRPLYNYRPTPATCQIRRTRYRRSLNCQLRINLWNLYRTDD